MQKYLLLAVKVEMRQVKMEKGLHLPSPGVPRDCSRPPTGYENASLYVLALIPETRAPVSLGRMNQCVYFLSTLVRTKRMDNSPKALSDDYIILCFVCDMTLRYVSLWKDTGCIPWCGQTLFRARHCLQKFDDRKRPPNEGV